MLRPSEITFSIKIMNGTIVIPHLLALYCYSYLKVVGKGEGWGGGGGGGGG